MHSVAKRRTKQKDRGAVMIEMVLVLPILIMFLFGIIEFGWAFSQHLDVRHGAREGLRMAQVNSNPFSETGDQQTQTLGLEVCGRMSNATGRSIEFAFPATKGTGDLVSITVEAPIEDLTGFFTPVIENISLKSTLHGRLERPATYNQNSGFGKVTCS